MRRGAARDLQLQLPDGPARAALAERELRPFLRALSLSLALALALTLSRALSLARSRLLARARAGFPSRSLALALLLLLSLSRSLVLSPSLSRCGALSRSLAFARALPAPSPPVCLPFFCPSLVRLFSAAEQVGEIKAGYGLLGGVSTNIPKEDVAWQNAHNCESPLLARRRVMSRSSAPPRCWHGVDARMSSYNAHLKALIANHLSTRQGTSPRRGRLFRREIATCLTRAHSNAVAGWRAT